MEESQGPSPVMEESGKCGTGKTGLFGFLPSPLVFLCYF